MPYSVDKYDGQTVTVVEDGTINNTLDIKLVGRDYPGYGEIQNENFVYLVENFAGNTAPPRPMNGQLWFDSAQRKIKFYDKLQNKWRGTGGVEVSTTAPSSAAAGDLWLDSTNDQIYVHNGTDYIMIGPQSVKSKGRTQHRSRGILDTSGTLHPVIEGYSDGVIIYIISNDTAFPLHATHIAEYANRFVTIKQGLNLAFTNSLGVSTEPTVRYWGTASDSDRLGGLLPSAYLKYESAAFPDVGFTVGDDYDLHIFVRDDTIPVIENQISNTIEFRTKSGATTVTPLKLVDNSLVPGITDITNIGSTLLKYSTVFANTFDGIALKSNALDVGGTFRTASIGAAANTIASRDSDGNLTANIFNGLATSARYADLAEKYLTDCCYDYGTVVSVGGEAEVTMSGSGDRAIGVISQYPAYMMNCGIDGQYVALKGRVPVKVMGYVNKGDRLIAWDGGVAIATTESKDVFAIALESSRDQSVKLIESLIL